MPLLRAIDVKNCTWSSASVGRATLTMRKAAAVREWWPRLLQSASKPQNQHTWWDKQEPFESERSHQRERASFEKGRAKGPVSLSLSLSLRPRHHHPSVRAIERVLCVSPTGDKEERSQKQDCVKKKNRGANSHMKTFEYRDEIEKEEAKRDKLEAKRARASSAANAETNDAPAAEEREPKTTADAAAADERGDSDAADSQADAQLAQDAQTAAKGRRAASLKRLAGSRKQRAEDAARALKRAVDESTTLPESVSKHSLSLSPFFPMEDAKKNAVDGRRAPSAKKRHPSSRAGAPQPRPRSSMRGYADKTPRSTPTPTPRSPTNSSRRPRPSPTTHSRPTTPQEERTRIRERTPPPAQASSD